MDRHNRNSVRLDDRNDVITARQAVPGTVVMVEGWGSFSQVTVARWEPASDGYATLYDTKGIARGQYRADDFLEAVK